MNEIKIKKLKTILKEIEEESIKILEGENDYDVTEIVFELSYRMYEIEMTKYYINNFIGNKSNVVELIKK